MTSICRQLRAAGIEPILATLPPRNDGAGTSLLRQMNNWIYQFGANSGIQVLDYYAQLVDPTNGWFKSGYQFDAIHPNAQGSMAAGHEFLNISTPPFARPYLTRDTADPMNVLTNGTFAGSGVATGWALRGGAGAGTDSTIAGDGSISGNWAQMVVTGASTRYIQQTFAPGAGKLRIGDTLEFTCLVSCSGSGGVSGPDIIILANGPVITFKPVNVWNVDFDRAMAQMQFGVPAGTTPTLDVLLGIVATGPCTVRFAQATLVNLTTGLLLASSVGSV